MIYIRLKQAVQSAEGKKTISVDTTLALNTIIGVFGASGQGKTTLFKVVAGLLYPDEGLVIYNDKTFVDTTKRINLPPQQRHVALMFQSYALFPNMTAEENLFFAQKTKDSKAVDYLLDYLEMSALRNRKPHQLSGGQQQRIAFARALLQPSDILLLDEPFSAVDTPMRQKMMQLLTEAQQRTTILIISHNREELTPILTKAISI